MVRGYMRTWFNGEDGGGTRLMVGTDLKGISHNNSVIL